MWQLALKWWIVLRRFSGESGFGRLLIFKGQHESFDMKHKAFHDWPLDICSSSYLKFLLLAINSTYPRIPPFLQTCHVLSSQLAKEQKNHHWMSQDQILSNFYSDMQIYLKGHFFFSIKWLHSGWSSWNGSKRLIALNAMVLHDLVLTPGSLLVKWIFWKIRQEVWWNKVVTPGCEAKQNGFESHLCH